MQRNNKKITLPNFCVIFLLISIILAYEHISLIIKMCRKNYVNKKMANLLRVKKGDRADKRFLYYVENGVTV